MIKDLRTSPKKGEVKSRMMVRLMRPMLLLVVLQLVTFFAILVIGGEFSYVRQYAYSTLGEKTQNRRNYIQNEFQQKIPYVRDSSDKINSLIAGILAQQNASISDLQTDKELSRLIMESSVDSLVELLRRSMVNDVYLILETGNLYSDGSNNAKASLYLRDLDTMTDAGYEDLLMETGFSFISQKFGIMLDSGWTLHFEPDPEDMVNYGFYYTPLQTAHRDSTSSQDNLGYWSGFSSISPRSSASMKYSVPLIAEDGTVYGILGIGLTESTILANLPSNDFINETACYVLGHSTAKDQFTIVTHSGASFSWLVGNTDTLQVSDMLVEDVFDFDVDSEVELAGSIKYINLYNQESPYAAEQWAVISVADRASVLRPLTSLVRTLIISAIVSVLVSVIVVILSCLQVVKPITGIIKTMNSKQEYNKVIRFQPSNIDEIDRMTDAITQLQINVQDFSSQVSKMIRIANVGLGTFMYDNTDDSVYVGQSFLKLLRSEEQRDEDVMMSRQEFLESMIAEETRQAVIEGLKINPGEGQADYIKEYSVFQEDGSTRWMRLSIVHTKNNSIGILQDITSATMEKKRIEFERDYDTTTGLLNRRAYTRRVEELFRDTAALKVTAFVMIDLDNLKYVNDTYGHDFGDDYIKTAATMLKKFQDYGGIVARLSGDEFNVCLSGFSSKEEIREIINKVRAQLLQSYCLLADGTRYKIRASAGISWYPDDAQSYELLMKYADFAMYTVKHATKGELAEFSRSAYESDSVLLTGVEEMNRILEESSVKYAFHSIISAKTGEVYGYEALMRPQSTVFQNPKELLRAAKIGAKLKEIERLTWTKALADFQAQIDAGHIAQNSYFFINSISNNILDEDVAEALEEAYPDLLSHIVLEILEGENVREEDFAHKMKRMEAWKARIALDDFGAGYNNEYALLTIQPHIIKIDRAIVSGCSNDISRRTIISNLVKLARTKQILVLAEGVETEEELKVVISCGVDLLQGFYFDRPLFDPQPLEPKITEMIRNLAASGNSQ